MAVSTRQIIKKSIKDIEDGLWTCNTYAQDNDAPKAKKPLGCAVGIVAINAGIANIKTNANGVVSATVPTDAYSYPKQARKALHLLAKTAKFTKQTRANLRNDIKDATDDEEVTNTEMSYVITYNDEGRIDADGYGGNITPTMALKWFKRALAALDG